MSAVPLPSLLLTGNTRASGWTVSKLRREQRAWGRFACLRALDGHPAPTWAAGMVAVRIDVNRSRAWSARNLDDDNLIAGLKGARDGIADALGTDDRLWRIVGVHWHQAPQGSGDVAFTLQPLATQPGWAETT